MEEDKGEDEKLRTLKAKVKQAEKEYEDACFERELEMDDEVVENLETTKKNLRLYLKQKR